MSLFSTDFVIAIRRRGAFVVAEPIKTELLLPEVKMTPAENRKHVIARLREDPGTIFVLEGTDGECHQTAELKDGVEVTLHFVYGEHTSMTLLVCRQGKKGFEQTWNDTDEQFESAIDYEEFVLHQICNTLTRSLGSRVTLAPETNDYVSGVKAQDGNDEELDMDMLTPLGLFDAWRALVDQGYQTEWITQLEEDLDYVPFLFVHENEVMMLGSSRFCGTRLFVERKFISAWGGCDEKAMESLRDYLQRTKSPLEWSQYADGSYGVRCYLLDSYAEERFLEDFNEAVNDLINLERDAEIDYSREFELNEQRQLFIYEVIEAEIKYNNLPF